MKTFLKIFFASFLALIVSFFVGTVALIVFISASVASLSSDIALSGKSLDGSVLHLTFEEVIVESPSSEVISAIDLRNFTVQKSVSLHRFESAIFLAAKDPKIKAIFLEPQIFSSLTLAQAAELRSALEIVKESGKPIIAYSESYSLASYFLCSLADEIYMAPEGNLEWVGMSATSTFLRGALDKLEIKPEIIRVGKFKSAVEQFTSKKMSSASRMQTQRLLDVMWNYIVGEVSKSRDIDIAKLKEYSSDLAVATSLDSKKLNFIDHISYRDGVLRDISELVESDGEVTMVPISKFLMQEPIAGNLSSKNKIAIIYVDGEITSGQDSEIGMATSGSICKQLKKARTDDDIKSVVLRINSPGGSALAADIMWREVALLQEKKPVVVSMGSVAASGGYYIAAPADVIVANPLAITGSIGVFGLHFNGQEGFENKLGITFDVVKSSDHADIGSMVRPMTTAEEKFLQKGVNSVYNSFISKVAKGRNMTKPEVHEVAQGRVWSALAAKNVGLVDKIGTLDDALALAVVKSGVGTDFQVINSLEEPATWAQLFSAMNTSMAKIFASSPFSKLQSKGEKILEMAKKENIQAIMPYNIEIE